jgi:hypothetical protein
VEDVASQYQDLVDCHNDLEKTDTVEAAEDMEPDPEEGCIEDWGRLVPEKVAYAVGQGCWFPLLPRAWVSFSLGVHLDDFPLKRTLGFLFDIFGRANQRVSHRSEGIMVQTAKSSFEGLEELRHGSDKESSHEVTAVGIVELEARWS